MNKRYFSFEKFCKVMGFDPEKVKQDKSRSWAIECDGAEWERGEWMRDKNGKFHRCHPNWCVEKTKRYFSAAKWKEDNKLLKSIIPFLYETSVRTFVQDCDGAEITEDNKMVGKSGGVYDVKNEDGVVYEKPIPEPVEKLTPKNFADLVKFFEHLAEDDEPEKGEAEKNPPRYRIVIECDGGDITTAEMVVNGKTVRKSSAKRNPADRFDFKTGAEYAFERLFKKEEKEEKPLKPLMKIKIVRANDSHGLYKDGDVLEVVHADENGNVAVRVENENDKWMMWNERKNTAFVAREEYVVFEEKEKPLAVGDRIVVHGLVKDTYINGMHGLVTGLDNGVHPDMVDKTHTSADANPRTATIMLDECPRNHEGMLVSPYRRLFADKLKYE